MYTRIQGLEEKLYYTCQVPSQLGVHTFDSPELIRELPRAGLPQFCALDPDPSLGEPHTWFASGRAPENTTPSQRERGYVTQLDVECAAVSAQNGEPDRLTVKLNTFATTYLKELLTLAIT